MILNNSWITWAIGLLVLLGLSISGYTVGRVDSIQNALSKEYVLKQDYNNDIQDLKTLIRELGLKVDRLAERR